MTLITDPLWSRIWSLSVSDLLQQMVSSRHVLSRAGGWAILVLLILLALGLMGLTWRRWALGLPPGRRFFLAIAGPAALLFLVMLPLQAALPLLVAGLTIWTYVGVERATPAKILAVLCLRLAALAVAFMMVLRPSLSFHEELKIPSELIIVVDGSDSMNFQDELGGKSRWDKALSVLGSPRCAALLEQLTAEKNVRIIYYRAAEDIAPFNPHDKPGSADGKRTDVGQWLFSLYQRHSRDQNLRAVVLFSDGADNGTRFPAGEQAELFQRIPCPIHTFAMGRKDTTLHQQDLAFVQDSLYADPSPVPIKNKLTVRARLQAIGYPSPEVTLRLFFDDAKEAVAVKTVRLDKPVDERNKIYEVEITGDAPPTPREMKVTLKVDPLPNEVSKENNEISTFVTVTKEGLSVLFVEGNLGWESAFICDAISAHRSLRLTMSYRTRDEPIPADQIDWFEFDKKHYDVVVIGNVTARRFSGGNQAILQKLRDLVDKEGAGLLMLGGEDTIGSKSDWNDFGKAIGDILPVVIEKQENLLARFWVEPTQAGKDHYIMRLDSDAEKNEKIWKDSFKQLQGVFLFKPKGGATVLAKQDALDQPVLVSSQYGKGRVLAYACDSDWNYWRQSDDAVAAHQRFWQQVMVWLAHQENQDDTVWVLPDARRVALGNRLPFSTGMRGKGDKVIPDARFQVKVIGPNGVATTVPTVKEKDRDRGAFDKTDVPG
jgi:uncharacterized membrane protein